MSKGKSVLVTEASEANRVGGNATDIGTFFTSCEEAFEVLYTGNVKEENVLLVGETKNKAVIDTGCTATVAGHDWVRILIGSLSEESQKKVEKYESTKTFRFGGGERRKSLGFWRIPCKMAEKNVMLETDVVDADIPCLLSKSALKRAGTILKLETDQAEIFGNVIDLENTTAGHYALSICDVGNEEEVLIGVLDDDYNKKAKEVVKIHKQFAHPPRPNMDQLLKDSGNMDADVVSILEATAAGDILADETETGPRSSRQSPNNYVAKFLTFINIAEKVITVEVDTANTPAEIGAAKGAEPIPPISPSSQQTAINQPTSLNLKNMKIQCCFVFRDEVTKRAGNGRSSYWKP